MKASMRSIRRGLLATILIYLLTINAHSQWEQVDGLYGGVVMSMASNDSLLFAGTMLGVSVCRINDPDPAWESFAVPSDPEITALALYRDSLIVGTPAGIYITGLSSPGLKDLKLNLPFDFILSLDVFIDDNIPYLVATVKQHGLFVFDPASYTWTEWNIFLWSTNVIDIAQGAPISGTSHYSYYALIEGDPWLHTTSAMLANWGWSFHLPSDQPANSIIFQDGYRVVGTNQGIFRQNTAYTWEPNPGSPVKTILQVCSAGYSGDSTGLLALAEDHTIYYSTDTAITWHQALPAYGSLPNPLTVLKHGDKTLMGSDGGGIYASTNLATWSLFEPKMEEPDVRSMISFGDRQYIGTRGAGIYRSKIYGGYEQIGIQLPSMYISYISVANNDVIVCAGGFMYYLDHEDHWHNFSYNMHDPNPCVVTCYTNTLSPLVMAKSTGIWTIDFQQDTVWHPLHHGLVVNGITELITDNNRMFICQPSTGVSTFSVEDSTWVPFTTNGLGTDYVSTITVHDSMIVAGAFDGIRALRPPYAQWTPENTGLSASNTIKLETYHDLIFASAYPRNFYVARSSSLEWHDRSDNLPEYTFIYDFYFLDSSVYAASNRGLWKRALGDMAPGIEDQPQYSAFTCFPNPCRDHLTVETGVSSGDITRIKLMDLQGKILIDQPVSNKGVKKADLPVSGISPGLYLVSVITTRDMGICKVVVE